MRHWIIGWLCAIYFAHAFCTDATAVLLPFKKTVPAPLPNIPWQELDERATLLAQSMLEKPTMSARGPQETFPCTPDQYFWLLDNPDRVVLAWRRLGAKCVNITRRGEGRFGYSDEQGSDVCWETIHHSPTMRIWFAEGKVKGGGALPIVPVKALVILRHVEGTSPDGARILQHQAEVIIHTDSKAAALVTKMMGQSATRVAEQALGQLQLFFSALSSYVDRHPDQADVLFRAEKTSALQQMPKSNR